MNHALSPNGKAFPSGEARPRGLSEHIENGTVTNYESAANFYNNGNNLCKKQEELVGDSLFA